MKKEEEVAVASTVVEWFQEADWQQHESEQIEAALVNKLRKILQGSSDTRDRGSSGTTIGPGSSGNNGNDPIKDMKDLAMFAFAESAGEEAAFHFSLVHSGGQLIWDGKESKDAFTQKISKLNESSITLLRYHTAVIERKSFDAERDCQTVRSVLFPGERVRIQLRRTHQDALGKEGTLSKEVGIAHKEYVEGIVRAMSPINIAFNLDYSKGQALVITGESGAGKSWYAKRYLSRKFKDASFIYCELGDGGALSGYEPKDRVLSSACSHALGILHPRSYADPTYSDLLDAVSEVSRRNNDGRNDAAIKRFGELVGARMESSETKRWWARFSDSDVQATETLEELVVIIDEAGKDPELARGLVDEVRVIYNRIRARNMAKDVMLVLVGSGLERFIECVGIETDDRAFNAEYASFGTDPTKSGVVELRGPDRETIDKLGELCGVPGKSILGGTYSRVLATNTRMLFRGVIPIFNSTLNTFRLKDQDLHERRMILGSTNHVMDACARIYIALNGLQRHDPETVEKKLQSHFRILFHAEVNRIGDTLGNPAYESQPKLYSSEEYNYALKSGLITGDVISTSKALRYLACNGQTAPLVAEDGISFEEILQHHLARLAEAKWALCQANANSQEEKKRQYRCCLHGLVQAWPPSSTKSDRDLTTEDFVSKEVESRYKGEADKERVGKDVELIAEKVADLTDFDVVIRQTVSTVQGADVMVLRKRRDESAFLDLYQAKHYARPPSRRSKMTKEAFASLGVRYEGISHELDISPKTGSAGYSHKGIDFFISALKKTLGFQVEFGNRIVAFSCQWESFVKSTTWKDFPFESASGNGVFVWGKEMMEPTISALEISGTAEEDDGKDDDEDGEVAEKDDHTGNKRGGIVQTDDTQAKKTKHN
ncbi:expressed unknown protein [Seminavis robusta]|uniref:Uncharacterized protein n=1 Tax=Seminavis robusta TaxID=568900 RepID=A0A9N8E7Z1_9STRA|nr:expressed unknown protein [Seminavis robusta]|eukprot:Sro593_g172330.1 n/a (890) ;mRNA; r:40470-43139